jgi:thiol reductant ABC exporter CydC subunit
MSGGVGERGASGGVQPPCEALPAAARAAVRGGAAGGALARLWRLVLAEGARVPLALALQVATLATGIALMAASAWLVSKAALRPSIADLSLAIVGVRAFGISRGLFRYLDRLLAHDVTLRLLARLRTRVYRALVPLAPARLVDARGGDVLGTLVTDVDTLEHAYVRVFGPTLAAAAAAGLIALLLWPRGAALALVALGGLACAGVVAPWLASRIGAGAAGRVVALEARLSAGLVDLVQGLADLAAFGRDRGEAGRLAHLADEVARAEAQAARGAATGGALAGLAADLTLVGIVAVAAGATAAGTLDGVQIAVVALAALASFEAVAPLPAAWQGLGATRAAARRVFELLDAPPAVDEPVDPAPPPAIAAVTVSHLTFTYPGAERPALLDVDISLEPGRAVAVVGPSGSGKTTLVNLLLRFWSAPAGSVQIGGIDVARLAGSDVRDRIAVLGQPVHLFTGTVRDNLRLARPAATDAELWGALEAACLEGVVRALPEGLDTWLGEQGLALSGGERQRLALARAYLKDAPILVLDEPTAHLDPITERDVMARLRAQTTGCGSAAGGAATSGRALLLITHRLVGLDWMDEIVVLDEGRIVERGRWSDLVAGGGPFERLWAAQQDRLDS